VWRCLRDPTFSRFSRPPTYRQTGRHTSRAYTALAWRRAVKTKLFCDSVVKCTEIFFQWSEMSELTFECYKVWASPLSTHLNTPSYVSREA